VQLLVKGVLVRDRVGKYDIFENIENIKNIMIFLIFSIFFSE